MRPRHDDEAGDLVPEKLRDVRRVRDLIREDVADPELSVSAADSHTGRIRIQVAGLNSRMDRRDERLTQVGRLELVEA